MMSLGYARIAPLEAQAVVDRERRNLTLAGCEAITIERATPSDAHPLLAKAVASLREGDTLTVSTPDRLAATAASLLKLEGQLAKRHVGLVILSVGGERLDTRLPSSRAMLTLIRGMQQWEKAIALARQAPGIQKARADRAKYRGRQRSINPAVVQDVVAAMSPTQAAKALRVSRSSIYRHLPPGHKAPPKPQKPVRDPPADRETVIALRRTMTPTQIARGLGTTLGRVRYQMRKADEEERTPDWRDGMGRY